MCGQGCLGSEREEKAPASVVPTSERRCTDLLFLFLFIIFWGGVLSMLGWALDLGADPNRILHGVDYRGRVCGVHDGVKDREFAAWPALDVFDFQVCVASCAETDAPVGGTEWKALVDPDGFWTPGDTVFPYASTKFLQFCVPTVLNVTRLAELAENTIGSSFESTSEDIARAVADILTAYELIMYSAFTAIIFSFLWTYLVRYIAGFLVWTALLLVLVGGVLLTSSLLDQAQKYEDSEVEDRAKYTRGMGWASGAATLAFILLVYCLRESIKIAIGVVKVAAEALGDLKLLLIFPVLPMMIGLGYFVYFVVVSLYIFSAGDPVDEVIPNLTLQERVADYTGGNTTYIDFQYNDQLKRLMGLNFFALLWNIQFLIYFTYMVAAGAVAMWYFSYKDENGNPRRGDGRGEFPDSPIKTSCHRALRFHLGSIAVGSLIIAIVRFIRACVKYVEEQMNKTGQSNACTKCMFCILNCCLYWVECCLDKVSKNAFIWIAIWGDSFGTAACSAFGLLWRNLHRTSAFSMVGAYLMMLGKIVVALANTGFFVLVMISTDKYEEELNSPLMPAAVIFLLSYLIASLFMVIFETAMDTTFLCFLVDEEHNKESGRMFASPELQKAVNAHQAESMTRAKSMHGTHASRLNNLGHSQEEVQLEQQRADKDHSGAVVYQPQPSQT